MATELSETRETSPKPSLKQAGATHQPQHLFPRNLEGETPPKGGFPRFGRCGGVVARFRGGQWLGSSWPNTESGRGGSAAVLTICATAKLTAIMMMVQR